MTTRRLTVSLQNDVYEAVTAQADRRGVSRTQIINELLSAAVPALNKMTALMDKVERMTADERADLAASLSAMADDAEAAASGVQRRLRLV